LAAERSGSYGILRVGAALVGIALDGLAEVCPIARLSPLLLRSEGLLGLIDLRGVLIPILDPSVLCGLPPGAAVPRFAAIVRQDGRLLGIGVDEIVGLSHPSPGTIQPLGTLGAADTGLVSASFAERGEVVAVIDPTRLFARSLVASAQTRPGADARQIETKRPVLTFVAGGATFAVSAIEVHGTVPRRPIDRNSLTAGACLGSITHHGRRIPVVETTQVLGLGRAVDRKEAEVVVVRFPENRLIGFAVDTIRRMLPIDPERLAETPAAAACGGILPRVLVDPDGLQVFLIAPDALRRDRFLSDLADLSRPERAETERAATPDRTHGVIVERSRYLVFGAGFTAACPITQVTRIVQMPSSVVPVESGNGVDGFFALDCRTVPLVRLARLLGAEPRRQKPDRVILVGDPGRRVGFVVDSVEGIETSAWRSAANTSHNQPPIVEVRIGEARRVLPVIDLLTHARALAG
jgi:chemotaxis signal transduction protein